MQALKLLELGTELNVLSGSLIHYPTSQVTVVMRDVFAITSKSILHSKNTYYYSILNRLSSQVLFKVLKAKTM
jgi:hypothetical protein